MTDTNEAVDERQNNRFRYTEGGIDSELVYRVDNGQLTLVHTEVSGALGGRGIAGRLVRAAVARAEESGETVLPWCPYVRQWPQDHPDFGAGITIDWSDLSR